MSTRPALRPSRLYVPLRWLVIAGSLAVTGCASDSSDVEIMKSESASAVSDGTIATGPTPTGSSDQPATSDPATTDPATTTADETDSTEAASTVPEATEAGSSDAPDTVQDPFSWTEFGDGLEEGHLDVPIDPDNPDDGSFTLYLIRRPADEPSRRIGTLLVNPGGPGSGGTFLAEFADQIYGQGLLDSFDIVGWDPRGTGATTPTLDCIDEYDPYFAIDSSPDTPAEQQDILDAAQEFGVACQERSGDILPFVSTEHSAGDMDAIRRALGEDTISYFGFSYGSELGVTWASLYPETMRAMVIDGAADQSVDYLQQNLEQAAGFEGTFDTFLAQCSDRPDCAFHNDGNAEDAFDEMSEAADGAPVKGPSGRPSITQGVLITAVANAMYTQSSWPELAVALDDLQNGDGVGILSLYDDYYTREPDGTYDNSLEAYFAINCLDDPGTKDPQVLFDMQDAFAEVAPRIGAAYILELQFCAAWPVPAVPPVPVDAAGAGPVVVVGTTGDPATPLISTRNMASVLEDGRLIVVTADQHTGYGLNNCVNDAVDEYLVDLTVPDDETECS